MLPDAGGTKTRRPSLISNPGIWHPDLFGFTARFIRYGFATQRIYGSSSWLQSVIILQSERFFLHIPERVLKVQRKTRKQCLPFHPRSRFVVFRPLFRLRRIHPSSTIRWSDWINELWPVWKRTVKIDRSTATTSLRPHPLVHRFIDFIFYLPFAIYLRHASWSVDK